MRIVKADLANLRLHAPSELKSVSGNRVHMYVGEMGREVGAYVHVCDFMW